MLRITLSHKALEIGIKAILLISSAFIVADMANTLTKGAMQAIPPFSAPAKAKRQTPPAPLPGINEEPAPITQENIPPLKLIGTISGAHPYIITLDPANNNKQEIYRLKDDIGGGWLVFEISTNRTIIRKGGRKEILEVKFIEGEPKKDVGAALKPGSTATGIRLNPSDVEGALSDMNKVMTQARVVPNLVDGKTSGYRIFNIAPGSIYTRLGLTNNDVVERVNGVEINSPDSLYQLFQQIKNEKKITVDFNRGGTRESVNIEIR